MADAATVPVEPDLPRFAFGRDTHLDPYDITAKRIVVLIGVRRVGARAAVVRVFVMIQDMFLVDIFFVRSDGHGSGSVPQQGCRRTGEMRL